MGQLESSFHKHVLVCFCSSRPWDKCTHSDNKNVVVSITCINCVYWMFVLWATWFVLKIVYTNRWKVDWHHFPLFSSLLFKYNSCVSIEIWHSIPLCDCTSAQICNLKLSYIQRGVILPAIPVTNITGYDAHLLAQKIYSWLHLKSFLLESYARHHSAFSNVLVTHSPAHLH